MQNLRRIGLTYYARFTIPRDRWEDCGRHEVVRTLQTRDLREARKRRAVALESIRTGVNADLVSRRLRPLDDSWVPSWQPQALRLREQVLSASIEPVIDEATGLPGPEGSPQDQLLDRAHVEAQDLEEQLGPRLGPRVARKAAGQFYDIAAARVLPVRLMAVNAGARTGQVAA